MDLLEKTLEGGEGGAQVERLDVLGDGKLAWVPLRVPSASLRPAVGLG